MTSASADSGADGAAAAAAASASSIPIGIDLGHSYSVIGVWRNDTTDVIANELGARSTPNIVAFTDKDILFGEPAHSQLATNLPNTLHHVKRMAGLHFHHPTVQALKAKVDYSIQPAKQQAEDVSVSVVYKGEAVSYSTQQLLGVMLGKLKAVADRYTGTDCKQCVLAAPATFSPAQRATLVAAGREAGLDVLTVLNEATAACIAFDLDLPVASKSGKPKENIAVVDVGGATTSVTLLQSERGVLTHKSSTHDAHLGGDDFDGVLADHFTREFKKQAQGADLTQSHRAVARLSAAVERAKRVLSSSTSASIELDGLYEGEDFYSKISRARFETLAAPLLRRLSALIARSLQHANLTAPQIDHVLLIGGSARIPKLAELVQKALGREARKGVNPEEAVAIGCTRQASLLVGRGKEWEAVNHAEEGEKRGELALAHSLGVEGDDGVVQRLLAKGTTVPTHTTFQLSGHHSASDQPLLLRLVEGERALPNENRPLATLVIPASVPLPITVSVTVDKKRSVMMRAHTGRVVHAQLTLDESMPQPAAPSSAPQTEEDERLTERSGSRRQLYDYLLTLTQPAAVVQAAWQWLEQRGVVEEKGDADEYEAKRREVEEAAEEWREGEGKRRAEAAAAGGSDDVDDYVATNGHGDGGESGGGGGDDDVEIDDLD